MGYTTEFHGSMTLNPPASPELAQYINKLTDTRRMKRDVAKLQEMFKGEHGFNGEYGTEGEFFVGGGGYAGQDHDASIIDYNTPPKTQPGLWCHWIISEDGTTLEWDDGEKFYSYVEWLQYIIDNFLTPNGITLEGEIEWRGEDWEDTGTIIATRSEISNPDGEVIGACTQLKTETK
jgi:hypothetical protein